ncbi:MAG: cbb3-type cytochrome c oxidase subunit I [Candidatus Hydrogenedentes bacterium]|nr:cbb3-type cytochrome c oxidase subunit I [Candidatus Hydrogenedentota bacterium]
MANATTTDHIDIPERDYAAPAVHYLNWQYTASSWLLTLDHKRIAILYLITISIFFMVGGLFATIFRMELLTPEGDLLNADTYNKMFTLHGVVMIFFFLIPSIPAVLGNFLLPLMIGAKDVAFPRLNLFSWYILIIGGTMAVTLTVTGGLDTGWTFYSPLSTHFANTNVFLAALTVFVTGFSSILTGLNFLVTIHKMRAPGLTWFRLPLFIWAIYATSIIQILGTPVVAITILLAGIERVWGVGIFDPYLGGDPVLFQHMFWFYSHPAVYIMILPGMGAISEIIACFSRNRVFGYEFIAFSSVAIAIIGFLVWGHHMYVSGQSMYAGYVFSILTMIVAVPSAIKIFNWTATLYKGNVVWATPMLYAIGFIGLFAIGGATGLFLGILGLDVPLHDTYFVVAHFHYVMVGGMVMAYLAGLHFWWPKMTGKMYPQLPAQVCAVVIFVGFNLTFFPQFLAGWMGMPRRYHSYHPDFQIWNVLSTAGAGVLGVGFTVPVFYFLWSLFYGKTAGSNPWGARGLEWEQCTSPPDPHNFHHTPVVDHIAYPYTGEETLSV